MSTSTPQPATPPLTHKWDKHHVLMWSLLASLLTALFGGGVVYALSQDIRTDVAFVGARLYDIKSPATGVLSNVTLRDFQIAPANTPMFNVDSDELYQSTVAELNLKRQETNIEIQSADIEVQEAQFAIERLENKLNNLQLNRQNALANQDRASELLQKSLISAADMEKANLAAENAIAAWNEARLTLQTGFLEKERLQQNRQRLKTQASLIEHSLDTVLMKERRTTVRLPKDTAIAKLLKEDGAWVEQGDIIANGYAPQDIWVDAYIDEQDLDRLAIGASAEIIFDGLPSLPMIGTIQSISPVGGGVLSPLSPNYTSGHVLRVTQRYIARIPIESLKTQDSSALGVSLETILRPGMSARVRIQIP